MAYRIEMFGDEIESLSQIDPLFGTVKQKYARLPIYPKSHYVVQPERKAEAIDSIVAELNTWAPELEAQGRMVEAQRIHQRTRFDLEMIKSMGYCHGIENYSRHFSGRLPGEAPPTLLDYFPRDFLLFIDESHATIPQVHGMWHGDRSRKQNLVDYGFRLPSAMDNRPLKFEEFENRIHQTIYVSATPGPYELTRSADGACGSAGGDQAGEGADRRPAGGDQGPGQKERAGAGDHADQAHERGSGRLLHRGGREVPVYALGD
jgi:excinuclease ABC subunit B